MNLTSKKFNQQQIYMIQNTILQIFSIHNVKDEVTKKIIMFLVDLFNNKDLQIRRKSDEVLRAMIEICEPSITFDAFSTVIQANKINS